MITVSAFRSLLPSQFGYSLATPELLEGQAALDMEQLEDLELTGLKLERATVEGRKEIFAIGTGITNPETLAQRERFSLLNVGEQLLEKWGVPPVGFDPAEECQRMRQVLELLAVPLSPGSSVAEAEAWLHPLFPTLVRESARVVLDAEEQNTFERWLYAVGRGWQVELRFRQDQLAYARFIDQERRLRSRSLDYICKARREAERHEMLREIHYAPGSALLREETHLKQSTTEWSRGINLPEENAADHFERERAERPRGREMLSLPTSLCGTDFLDLEIDDLEAQLHHSSLLQRQMEALHTHGSLAAAIQASEAEEVFALCSTFDHTTAQLATNPHAPGLGRAAWVLSNFHHQVAHRGGLETWLTTYLEESMDFFAAMRLIEAEMMLQFLSTFVKLAHAEGVEVDKEGSWEEFFAADPHMPDEKMALKLLPELATQFKAWALSQPELLDQLEAAARTDAETRTPVSDERLVEGMKNRALKALAGAAPALEAPPEPSATLETTQSVVLEDPTFGEQDRLRAKYDTPHEILAEATDAHLLSHYLAWHGATDASNTPAEADPQLRCAACLQSLRLSVGIGAVQDWFEFSWDSDGEKTLQALDAVGAQDLAEGLRSISERIPDWDAENPTEDRDWDAFFSAYQASFPTVHQFKYWTKNLPALFRSYAQQETAAA